jgi:hypothetical protein
MLKLLPLTALLALAAGCVPPVAFKPDRPVTSEPAFLSRTYQQDGQQLPYPTLLRGLKEVEASREEALSAARWAIGGAVVGGAGGAAFGYGLVLAIDGKSEGWAWLAGGAAVGAVGMWLGAISDGHAAAGVEAYNAQLRPPKVSVAPYLAPVAQATPGGRDSGLEGGLVLRF